MAGDLMSARTMMQVEDEWIRQRQMVEIARLENERMNLMRRVPFHVRGLDPGSPWDVAFPQVDLTNAPVTEPDRTAIPRFGVALADESEGECALAKEAETLLGYNVLRRKLKMPGKLGEILACLDIEPLNTEAVEKYKRDMVLFRQKELAETIYAMPEDRFVAQYRIDVSWRRQAIANCTAEIPFFALRKAVQVKKACPEVVLEVDELIEEKKLIDPFLVASLEDEVYYLEVWKEPKFEATL